MDAMGRSVTERVRSAEFDDLRRQVTLLYYPHVKAPLINHDH